MLKEKQISIIGFGNVGYELSKALLSVGIQITHICTRSPVNDKNYPETTFVTNINELPKGQLTLICIPDGEIERVLKVIPTETPVAYTSGSVKLETITHQGEIGVFYPLQTFTKGISVDLTNVPFYIESKSEIFGKKLFALASELSGNVQFANSDVRSKLHLAAIWVNNFTNHVNYIAKEYLDSQQLDFEDLKPLLKETIRKIDTNSPYDVQTGPARRGDLKTIEKHLTMLDENRREIYRLLTESIENTYHKNDKL